jgi:thioredoxin 1
MAELRNKKREISSRPIDVTDGNFNETTSQHALALVDFWASWCGACQGLAPTIEDLAEFYSGRVLAKKWTGLLGIFLS